VYKRQVIVKGQTNLLPANKNISTQEKLLNEYEDTYIIHDNSLEISPLIKAVSLQDQALNDCTSVTIPNIDNNHLACISFTSGSTGKSSPNLKYWHTLYQSTDINYEHMIPSSDETLYQLATVPAQHMWGLETSVLMSLFKRVCVSDAKPLFPQDILDNLANLPHPKMLVSTPVRLRALASIKQSDISLHLTLCATSPLTKQLAQTIEGLFKCPLIEVYGCSEVGSMASRRSTIEETWQRFRNIEFARVGQHTYASARHLPETIQLQDSIEILELDKFRLAGRSSDLVKIAGKRGSLLEINQVLLSYEGLIDGVVVSPEDSSDTKRLVAVVVLSLIHISEPTRPY